MTEQILQSESLPKIRVKWLRGYDKIDYDRPKSFTHLGQRGGGKSSLLEVHGVKYYLKDGKLIDLFGSRDCESLAWLRSPFKNDDILLVHADSVEINSCPWDTQKISSLNLQDIDSHGITVSASAFYSSLSEEFYCMNELIKLLWARRSWRKPWFLMIREAANFLYSRIKVEKSQTIAKADLVYTIREGRHNGVAVGVDTLRWTAIDKEIRDISDYTFIKQVGNVGLPEDIRFIYRYIEPPRLMSLSPEKFMLLCLNGAIGYGTFDYPNWHKEEREDIVKEIGLKIEYNEEINYGDPNKNVVSDFEHADIIRKYLEIKNMHKVGKALKRSSSTIRDHIQKHDDDAIQRGECRICKRVNAASFDKTALKKNWKL